MGRFMRTARSVIVWTGFATWGATALAVWVLPAKIVVFANSGMLAPTAVAWKRSAHDRETLRRDISALRIDRVVLVRTLSQISQRRGDQPRRLHRIQLAPAR